MRYKKDKINKLQKMLENGQVKAALQNPCNPGVIKILSQENLIELVFEEEEWGTYRKAEKLLEKYDIPYKLERYW